MELDEVKTAIGFILLYGVVAVGTWMSPMQQETVVMVLGGLFVFGVLTLVLGVWHGQYRATTR